MAFQQNAFQSNAFQDGGQGADAARVAQRWNFVDGNAGVALLGAAIGAFAVWGAAAATVPAATQPTPQAAQWEFASRNVEQPQPQFSRGVFTVAAAGAQPHGTWFARPQDDPSQLQPQVWRQQLDLVAVSAGQGTYSPQQFEPDRQPQFWRAFFAPAASQNPPPAPFRFASPQADPSQQQPLFVGQTVGQRVAPALRPAWFVPSQEDPIQIQPQVWRQYLLSAVPVPTQFFASPQADPTQLQPRFDHQQLTSAQQAPVVRSWFAAPQEDPSQTQPRMWQAQPGNLAPAPSQWFATRQDDPSQLQPQVWRQQLTSAAVAPQPNKPWFAAPQDDPAQLQPQFWRLQFSNVAPPTVQWFATRQDDPTQVQPQVWRLQFANVAPAPSQFFVPPQADPTQLPPWLKGQVPPSQATQTPPTRPWFASPQADPSQLAPTFFQIAFLPSVEPPPPPPPPPPPSSSGDISVGSGGGWERTDVHSKGARPSDKNVALEQEEALHESNLRRNATEEEEVISLILALLATGVLKA